MATNSFSWSEEVAFSCPICLDVFSSPVSTPCGHNFCRTCITTLWDLQVQYKCPVCNELFHTRPEIRVNSFISEMAAEFTKSVRLKEPYVEPGEVPCDVCTGTQLKAVKSCLMCLTSYCHTHLEPHQRVAGLKRHQLVDPMDRLEDRIYALRRSLDQLEETLNAEMKKLHDVELEGLQRSEVNVTLDPDTANPQLIVSGDKKQVHDGEEWAELPDTPERFTLYPYVLAEQSFSSGRFYFEVQTKGKTKWEIGVARGRAAVRKLTGGSAGAPRFRLKEMRQKKRQTCCTLTNNVTKLSKKKETPNRLSPRLAG
ncbi:unnamed protein product [Lota lota]